MTTRTRIARITAIAAVLLAAPAYAQLKQGAAPIVLKMGNEQGTLLGFTYTWTGGKVAADQWDSPVAPPPAKAAPATLEFVASTGAPRTFYNWVAAPFRGMNAPQGGDVVRRSPTGVQQVAQFSGAVVGEVDFPAFTAAKQKQEAEFTVRARGQWLSGAATKEAKVPMPVLEKTSLVASPVLSGYRLSLGSVQLAPIAGADPFTLKPLQPAKITLHTRPPTTEALQKLAMPPKTKQPVGETKAPGLEGRLELLGADGRTVFATIMLHGVRLEAGGPASALAAIAGTAPPAPGLVILEAARTELAFFPLKLQ